MGKLCVSRSDIQNKWEKIGEALVQYHVWKGCKQKFARHELKHAQTLERTRDFRVLVCFEETSKIPVKKSLLYVYGMCRVIDLSSLHQTFQSI